LRLSGQEKSSCPETGPLAFNLSRLLAVRAGSVKADKMTEPFYEKKRNCLATTEQKDEKVAWPSLSRPDPDNGVRREDLTEV
jgi:hypothetical protein